MVAAALSRTTFNRIGVIMVTKVLILGAGPSGLSAAIALSKISTSSSPLQIIVTKIRPKVQTIGGAVSLTPLALRYLYYLGAGEGLRRRAQQVASIDMMSLRNDRLLGSSAPCRKTLVACGCLGRTS